MPAPSHVTVGLTASLTGRYSHPGGQALVGARAWAEATNRSGGIRMGGQGGRFPVRLVYYDDQSDAGRCALLTERLLIQDGADLLLGPYSSGLALKAAEVAERHRRVLWNHGGASETIYQRGYRCVVGILTPPRRYFEGIIDMVRDFGSPATNMVVLHSTAGAFPTDVASGAGTYGKERGFDPVRTLSYGAGTTDFRLLLQQLERLVPGLILAVGRIEDDISFARQFVNSGLTVDSIGLIATPMTLFRQQLGEPAEQFIGPSQWEPSVDLTPDYGPSPTEVLKKLKAQSPGSVDYPMAQAYAGCLVAQWCVEEAGSLDNGVLRSIASTADFTTFYGRFSIDPVTGRQLGHLMPVVRWARDGKEVVWPSGMKPRDP